MGSVTDIFAGIITIVLFIILAYKIYKNSKMMRGTDKESGSGNPENFMHDFVDQPLLWVKLAKGIDASTPDEEVQMSLMVNAAFQEFEAQCTQADAGELEENGIIALEEGIHRICAMPGVEKYLDGLKSDFSPRLLAIVDQKAE